MGISNCLQTGIIFSSRENLGSHEMHKVLV